MTSEGWAALKQRYPFGAEVTGTVDRAEPFGIFISVEGGVRDGGFADVAGMRHGGADGSSVIWPDVGDSVTGVVVDRTDGNQRVKTRLR